MALSLLRLPPNPPPGTVSYLLYGHTRFLQQHFDPAATAALAYFARPCR